MKHQRHNLSMVRMHFRLSLEAYGRIKALMNGRDAEGVRISGDFAEFDCDVPHEAQRRLKLASRHYRITTDKVMENIALNCIGEGGGFLQ